MVPREVQSSHRPILDQRSHVADAPMGPKAACSTAPSKEEEAIVVAFRKHTLLPLDDRLYFIL